MAKIRVLIVDDHAIVRAGLRMLINPQPDMEVVGEAASGEQVVTLAATLQPDVIVMDLSMGEMDGAEATKALVGKKVRAKVLILTMHAEDSYLVPLLEAGASGYLVKSAADRELIDAVRAVAHGDVVDVQTHGEWVPGNSGILLFLTAHPITPRFFISAISPSV